MTRIQTQPTPNPNSLKITREEPFLEGGMESFASAEEAAGHPLGEPLFDIDGVTNVFILPDFLTITKRADIRWDDILPAARQVLEK